MLPALLNVWACVIQLFNDLFHLCSLIFTFDVGIELGVILADFWLKDFPWGIAHHHLKSPFRIGGAIRAVEYFRKFNSPMEEVYSLKIGEMIAVGGFKRGIKCGAERCQFCNDVIMAR